MPAVPTVPTFSPGIVSATDLGLLASVSRFATNPPRAELRATVVQLINNGAATPINFDTADVDTDIDGVGGHNPAVNPSRFTARYPGWYEVSGGVVFAAAAANRRVTWFKVNGVDVSGTEAVTPGSAAGSVGPAARSKLVYLAIGDYVELVAYQDSGGALNTAVVTFEQPNMTVRWKSS